MEKNKIEQNDKIDLLDLINTTPMFERALVYADKLSTDELFEKFDKLDYPAFGFPMIQLYKSSGNYGLHSQWETGLRNPKDWREPTLECKGSTIKETMKLMYAWCVYKGYLPNDAVDSISAKVVDANIQHSHKTTKL